MEQNIETLEKVNDIKRLKVEAAKMASQQQHGQLKWYNFKPGYGFISDFSTKTDVFIHFSGLKRSLQKRLPREGDKVHFTVHNGDKGPEARDVARNGNNSKACASRSKPPRRTWDMEAKITACICTAKALAGSNVRRLQVLIPLLLQHNNLPGIRIPQQAFGASHTPKPPKSHQPLRQDDDHPCHEEPVEEALTVEEEEEDEIVDVEGSDSDQRRLDNTQEEEEEEELKKIPAAEAESTPKPSPHSETANQDDTEELHTIHYLLRRKNPGTKREDTQPNKITFSEIIKGYDKNQQDKKKRTNKQNTVHQYARRGLRSNLLHFSRHQHRRCGSP
ncbi:Cold shock-like protein CspB [Portunus trituberculatus]|uniref:Cold shock-like protein CspB n=1 Tax=Portunus trituberculatus TaxID=210409 RepID=A0A5B7HMS6_PORTR|nr:Cold shock-like protein CspB [Portunus trituberculatus]